MSNIKGAPKKYNGDWVVKFTNSKKVMQDDFLDVSSLSAWYQTDPASRHLGLIDLFSAMSDEPMPAYKNFFKTGAVLELNGIGDKFTYDVQVSKNNASITVADTSNLSEFPGINGTPFQIVLDRPYRKGDVLTYDAVYGAQLVISEDYNVEQEGEGWRHVAVIQTGGGAYFPPDKLRAGIEYFKIGHTLGEYSTEFSGFSSMGDVGTLGCEFVLGNHRGVETAVTMYADMKSVDRGTKESKQWLNYFKQKMEAIGEENDMFVTYQQGASGGAKRSTLTIGSTWEYLIGLELMKIEIYQNLFQKGGIINNINGVKLMNEGIVPQYRRGKRITYSKPGGITRQIFREISSYLFRNRRDLKPHERVIKLKCGWMAYVNVTEIFKDEANYQLQGLAKFLGTDRVLPKSPVTGTDLQNLGLELVQFSRVTLSDIGTIIIEHDPSMDYQGMTDSYEKGFFGMGYPRTSFSMIIEDASDPQYSNAVKDFQRGAKQVSLEMDGQKKFVSNANLFYVKPERGHYWWGRHQGRYDNTAREILASNKLMGTEYFAHSCSANWVKDLGLVVIVELEDSAV